MNDLPCTLLIPRFPLTTRGRVITLDHDRRTLSCV